MATTWTIAIDWDRNNSFADTDDDVTTRVIEAKWFLGFDEPYKDVALNSVLTLILDNRDRRFSPENAVSPLAGKVQPFKPVRIQSDDGTTVRTHWLGWIETIQPAVGVYGKRTVHIIATGPLQFYLAAETHLPMQEHKRTNEIIAELLKEVVMPPALSDAWVLGRIGNSEVGRMRLADTTAYSDLDEGIVTLTIAADNWVRQGGHSDVTQDTFDVYRAIRDITAAERGRFLFSREGKALFWNRHRLLDEYATAATFDDTMIDLNYVYAGLDQCKNELIVVCHPRTISPDADQILWELGDAIIRVQAGKKRTIYIKYQDADGNRVGGRDVTVNDLDFEQGTATATIKEDATGTELIFDNTSGTVDAVIKKCIIKGRKITDFDHMEAKATDAGSIIDFGRRTLRLNLPSVDSLDAAQSIADFEKDRRKQPRGEVRSLSVKSHGTKGGTHHNNQLARTLGDRIDVEETQAAHSFGYYIIGEAHKLSAGATLFETTWYLEPTPETYPWKLGVVGRSELGAATRLTY